MSFSFRKHATRPLKRVAVALSDDDLTYLDKMAATRGCSRASLIASIVHEVVADDKRTEAA